MGGTIWVESEQGRGSMFHFTMLLPWAPPDVPPEAAGPPEGEASDAGSDHGGVSPEGSVLSGAATRGWRGLSDGLDWTGPSQTECSALQGRAVIIDVPHEPTALQVPSHAPPP